MKKYTECHNCENKSDCERTYLGGCTDGEEKKLNDPEIDVGMTDEEIVKAFEGCTNGKCKNCAYRTDMHRCKHKKLNMDILDLIRRLQSENKRLTEVAKDLEQRYLEESKERCEFEQKYKEIRHAHNIGLGAQRSQWEKKVKQAVKDTAKEILNGLRDMRERLVRSQWREGWNLAIDNAFIEIKERYGVEVE